MKNYEARVSRSGKWWYIVVPDGGPLAMTQARRLSEVEYMVRDLLSNIEGTPKDFTVSITLTDADLANAQAVTAEARRAAAMAEAKASAEMRSVAAELVGQGLPVRDVAVLLDISPSRVSQLTSAA